MNRRNGVAWLYAELPRLEQAGVVPHETAARLHEYYGEAAAPSRRRVALILFSILGASSIGLGIILLLAHNWDMLSRYTRTVLAFLPLLAGQAIVAWTLMNRPRSTAWREGSGAFLTLTIGACIALISQTYHIKGDLSDFLLTWIVLAGPLVYILNATTVALLFMAGITCWAAAIQHEGSYALLFWPLAAFLSPHIWWAYKHAPEGPRTRLLTWGFCLALTVATGLVLERTMPGLWIIVYSALFCTLLLAGTQCAHCTAFRIAGFLGSAVMTLILTYEGVWQGVGWDHYRYGFGYHPWAAWQDYCFALAGLAAVVVLAVRGVERGDWRAGLASALAVVAVLGFTASALEVSPVAVAAAFNGFALFFGGGILVLGLRNNELMTVNAGMGLLSMLIILRFFDADLSFTIRGILFIVLGLAFLAVNLVLVRRAAGHKEIVS